MCRYDAIDATLVAERVAQLRDPARRHPGGELSQDEFRPLRLQGGPRVRRHSPRLRVAIPGGDPLRFRKAGGFHG